MTIKEVFGALFLLLIIVLMFFYFFPFGTTYFSPYGRNDNFSVIQGSEEMQFYPNLRFPNTSISYKIQDCPMQKQKDMRDAFDIIESLTLLKFYPVTDDEEISVTCSELGRYREGLYIAGEGGPTNITVASQFNVITFGELVLVKESNCQMPNIALHELLHVLGFKHSENKGNIMYEITSCDQTIGYDMMQLINNLYATPSYPDLAVRNVSASLSGRFLEINLTIMNVGLSDAGESKVDIYADDTVIKEISLKPIFVGYQRMITIKNIFIAQLDVKELNVVINSDFNEINKENNKIKLEIK